MKVKHKVSHKTLTQYYFCDSCIVLLCVCCQDGSDGNFPMTSDFMHNTVKQCDVSHTGVNAVQKVLHVVVVLSL